MGLKDDEFEFPQLIPPTTTEETAGTTASTEAITVTEPQNVVPVVTEKTQTSVSDIEGPASIPEETTQAKNENNLSEYSWLKPDDYVVQSYLVTNLADNKGLSAEYTDLVLEQGGFVRLMVLYSLLVDRSLDLNSPVVLEVTNDTSSMIGDRSVVSAETAIVSMFFEGNEAASIGLAKTFGHSVEEFLQTMNRHAKDLGMSHTIYNSLSDNDRASKTTVKDLFMLIRALERIPEFKALIEANSYAVPGAGPDSITGIKLIQNPAAVIDAMSSDYLLDLKGIMLTQNADNWSYGIAQAKANDGSTYLAIVMGASSKIEAVQGDLRAAQVLRTLLEETAISEGVQQRDKSGVLSIPANIEQPLVAEDTEPAMKVVEKNEAATESMTSASSLETEPVETPAMAATQHEKKDFSTIFLIFLGILICAIIILLIVSIIVEVKKHNRMKEKRQERFVTRSKF